jgi:hypothetical protein
MYALLVEWAWARPADHYAVASGTGSIESKDLARCTACVPRYFVTVYGTAKCARSEEDRAYATCFSLYLGSRRASCRPPYGTD